MNRRLFAVLLVAAVACGEEEEGEPIDTDVPTEVTGTVDTAAPPAYESDIGPLFEQKCGVACHLDGSSSGSLNLDAGYDAIVDVPSVDVPSMSLVEPGDPDNSYLWHKIAGTHLDVGGAGGTMPKNTTFSANKRDLLEEWILIGAPR